MDSIDSVVNLVGFLLLGGIFLAIALILGREAREGSPGNGNPGVDRLP